MKKLYVVFILSGLIFAFSSTSQAQTIYKNNPGFFAGLKSLELSSGSFESNELIGPVFGYRFNKNFDISLHTELLLSKTKFSGNTDRNLSLLNLGILLGHTWHLAAPLMLRSEFSFYKSFTFSRNGFGNIPDPSLSSAVFSSSIYARLPISHTISFLPNIGGFLGYGDYARNYIPFELSQGFDGFIGGPQFGLDILFRLSHTLLLTVEPRYRITYNTTHSYSNGEFGLNFHLNF